MTSLLLNVAKNNCGFIYNSVRMITNKLESIVEQQALAWLAKDDGVTTIGSCD